MALTPGTRLGHYDVTALLGEGGVSWRKRAISLVVSITLALSVSGAVYGLAPRSSVRIERLPTGPGPCCPPDPQTLRTYAV